MVASHTGQKLTAKRLWSKLIFLYENQYSKRGGNCPKVKIKILNFGFHLYLYQDKFHPVVFFQLKKVEFRDTLMCIHVFITIGICFYAYEVAFIVLYT